MAVCSAAFPAFAVTVGDLQVLSNLNEPFSGTVWIEDTDQFTGEQLKAHLGTPDDFEKAGLERPFYLREFQFELRSAGKKRKKIEIYTRNPVQEPIVSFVLALDTPAGRQLRQYTVFLDPPPESDRRANFRSRDLQSIPLQQDIAFESKQAPKPIERQHFKDEPRAVMSADAVRKIREDLSAGQASMIPKAQIEDARYGPTTTSDTLWRIALRVPRPKTVSNQQVMMAIVAKNPKKFVNQNMNGLMSGVYLDLPNESEIRAFTAQSAYDAAKAHEAAWKKGVPLTTKITAPAAATPKPPPEKKIAKDSPAKNEAQDGGKLTLLSAEDEAIDAESLRRLLEETNDTYRRNLENLEQQLVILREENALLKRALDDVRGDRVLPEFEEDVAEAPVEIETHWLEDAEAFGLFEAEPPVAPEPPAQPEPEATAPEPQPELAPQSWMDKAMDAASPVIAGAQAHWKPLGGGALLFMAIYGAVAYFRRGRDYVAEQDEDEWIASTEEFTAVGQSRPSMQVEGFEVEEHDDVDDYETEETIDEAIDHQNEALTEEDEAEFNFDDDEVGAEVEPESESESVYQPEEDEATLNFDEAPSPKAGLDFDPVKQDSDDSDTLEFTVDPESDTHSDANTNTNEESPPDPNLYGPQTNMLDSNLSIAEEGDAPAQESTKEEGAIPDAELLAQADIYIAYSRHKQAVPILEGLIEKDPNHMMAKLKLLACYGAMQETDKIRELAKNIPPLEEINDPDLAEEIEIVLKGLEDE